jgi:hypothetical protein
VARFFCERFNPHRVNKNPLNHSGVTTMKTKHDWTRADALTDDQIHAAASPIPTLSP